MSTKLLDRGGDNPHMTKHDAISCRLMAARWRLDEVRTTYARLAALKRGDMPSMRAAELWAEICVLRQQAWREEVERV